MLSTVLLLVATAFTGAVHAQNYSTSGDLTINPQTVDPQTRAAWCNAQIHNCPLICGSDTTASTNLCDSNALSYTCTCANNNMPNISNYANTIPSYVCGQWKGLCVAAHPNDLLGQDGCLSVTCGNASINDATTSTAGSGDSGAVTTSSTGTATAAATTTTAGTTSSTSAAPTKNAAPVAVHMGAAYTSGITAAGLLAIFGLAL